MNRLSLKIVVPAFLALFLGADAVEAQDQNAAPDQKAAQNQDDIHPPKAKRKAKRRRPTT